MSRSVVTGPGAVYADGRELITRLSDGSIYADNVITNRPLSYQRYWHKGVDTPDFYKRRNKGELLPMTSWQQYNQTGSVYHGYRWSQDQNYKYEYWDFPSYPAFQPQDVWLSEDLRGLIDEPDYGALVANAAANIYSQGFDGLTFIVELHKTFQLFRGFLKRNLDNLISGQAYNNWLEARYGWRILVLEMLELQENLASFDRSRERYKQSVGYSDESSSVTNHAFGASSGTYNFTTTETIAYSARGSVIMDIKPPQFSFNPITTAWEIIPYSFVIDWFVGVGTWFESLSALALSKSSVSAGGLQITVTKETVSTGVDAASNWTVVIPKDECLTTATQTVRLPIAVPSLPQIGLGLDRFKIIDLISLLLQRVPK
jgi:hypothetical protein